jgi:hypothetical protein
VAVDVELGGRSKTVEEKISAMVKVLFYERGLGVVRPPSGLGESLRRDNDGADSVRS